MPTPAILITGGTSGIGLATARLLHERGCRVIVTGSSAQSVQAAERALPDGVLAVAADARSAAERDRLADLVREHVGSLTAMFLNAGVRSSQRVEQIDEATFDRLVDVNFKGQFFTMQRLLPLLADGGSIVFTVGVGATSGVVGGTVTAATRGALLTLVPSLALELAGRGIRVNAVSPGAIDTPMWAQVPADVREAVGTSIPFGRLGEAADVAGTVAFLTSDASAYVTGQNVVVSGGVGMGR